MDKRSSLPCQPRCPLPFRLGYCNGCDVLPRMKDGLTASMLLLVLIVIAKATKLSATVVNHVFLDKI